VLDTFARISAVLMLLVAAGCAETGAEDEFEQVALDYSDVGLDLTDDLDAVDPGDMPQDPCGCGDDYQCLADWAEEAFRCGVCATITCPQRNLDVCTDFCGLEMEMMAGSDIEVEAER
jgi:hypothetical protein